MVVELTLRHVEVEGPHLGHLPGPELTRDRSGRWTVPAAAYPKRTDAVLTIG